MIYEALDYLFFDNVDFAVNMSGLKLTLGLTSGEKLGVLMSDLCLIFVVKSN